MSQEPEGQGPDPQMETSASLLEDASTLLMFHNTAITAQGEKDDKTLQSKPPQLLPNVSITKSSKSPSPTRQSLPKKRVTPPLPPKMSGISSPGPAIAALADSDPDGTDKEKGPNQNQKAIVAAAALAAAAGIPLPLIRNNTNTEAKPIDDRQSLSPRQQLSEVTKEQLQGLEQKSEIMKHAEDFTAKPIDEDARSDATTADMNRDDDEAKEEDAKLKDETSDEKDTVGEDDTQDEKSETSTAPVKKRTKKTKTNSVLKDYIVDPNAGTITCVCGYEHDDGFTIQCDHCNRWQHALCMGIDSMDEVPEKFQCNVCQPRKLDVKKAKLLQQKRRKISKEDEDAESDDAEQVENGSKGEEQKPLPVKPKPKTPINAYGKNLEESDIKIPEGQGVNKVAYYKLRDWDYQDSEVYRFVQDNIKQSTEPSIIHLTSQQYKNAEFAPYEIKPYTEVNNKKFNGIIRMGMFAEENIETDDFVQEYLGEIGFKHKYIADSRNQYRIWGVEKPYVSFVPYTSLVIDARLSGNSTRFIRRSCHPNCEIRIVNVNEKDIKFIVVALKPIKAGSELTLQWNWDHRHPIRSIIDGNTFDSTADSDKPCLVLSVESILSFVECACTQTNECALSKVKKASAHIYRSTRKGNSTSGLKLMQKESVYVSIQERLLARNVATIRDTEEKVKNLIPLLQSANATTEAEITVRPYIYTYMRKRHYSDSEEKSDGGNLAIPIEILADDTKVKSLVDGPPKPVKKLSFADYKKKKKPL